MEPTVATVIRCIFLELNQIKLNMFRASLCPSSGDKKRDWLKLHVKLPAIQATFFLPMLQEASHEVLTSLVSCLLMMGIMMPETC
jgi:hypothetical protein